MTLGKTDWEFNVVPCSGDSGWVDPFAVKDFEKNVSCNCSYENNTVCHITSIGYMAPEYATRGYLTEKADVYSFGVVAFEIVSGKCVMSYRKEGRIHLLDWVHILRDKGQILEFVDQRLEMDFDKEEATRMINVALLRTNMSPTRRPTMSTVVSMLNAQVNVPDIASDLNSSSGDLEFIVSGKQYGNSSCPEISHGQSLLVDRLVDASTTSASDLYPINADSLYWSQRD